MHYHRLVRAALTAVAVIVLAAIMPSAAHAQGDVYRFWGYYQWTDGAWAITTAGPAEVTPTDGSVEGWRYAVAGLEPRAPRADGDFDLICGEAVAGDGEKRVAVVLDFGTQADSEDGSEPPAARGVCAVVPDWANGSDILLRTAGDVRIEQGGLTCGIAGYPATGCGGPVATPAPTGPEEQVELALPAVDDDEPAAEEEPLPADQDEDNAVPVGLLVGLGIVVVVGVAAAVRFRGSKAA